MMAEGGLKGAARPKAALSADDLERLAQNLKVLGNPKRLHLLQFLVRPHYIEEIASELKMARQTAQEHIDRLLEIGVVERRRGRRDTGPVTEYVVVPQRLFSIHSGMGKLGGLEPDYEREAHMRMQTTPALTGMATPQDEALPRLIIVHGMHVGRATALSGDGPWLIGRDPTAQFCLDYDPFVSTRHAEVRRVKGGFEVADMYSSNGTYVDWDALERGGARTVKNGTLIGVGKSILLVREGS